MHIGLSEIAYRAKCLEIFQYCLAALAPRDNMVDVKLDHGRMCRARAARATSEAVTLKNMPAKAERWLPACSTAGGFCAGLKRG